MPKSNDEEPLPLDLTDDERAAIEEAHAQEAQEAEKAAKAEPKVDAKEEVAAAAEPEPKLEAKEDKPAPRPPRQAVPDWQAPENAEARLAEIARSRDELADRFDHGELTARELLAEQRRLDKDERSIERAADRAQMAGEMTVAVWEKSTVPAFLDAHAHYRNNPVLLGMLDAEVRRQQAAASGEGRDPLDPAVLNKADEAIRQALGVFAGKPASKPHNTETPPRPEIPPTLGKIPAAEITGTDSKYASLDRLADADPLAFEDAMATLSQSEREAYLARMH